MKIRYLSPIISRRPASLRTATKVTSMLLFVIRQIICSSIEYATYIGSEAKQWKSESTVNGKRSLWRRNKLGAPNAK